MSGNAKVAIVDRPTDSFRRLTERLAEASVRHRWEAYRDVDWDAPGHEICRDDRRWETTASWDPLAACEWYREQPPERRSAIGLFRQTGVLKVGIEFERVLAEGLLRFAATLPNGHPAFRYVYHEVAEEAQHSLMFQELINRAGFDPPGASAHVRTLFRKVSELGGDLPVLFFLAALSGEESFDYVNRKMVATPSTHPLMARVSRIHVTEEARHVSFARALLRDAVPRLDSRAVRHLRYQAAFVVDWTATHMFELTESFLAAMDVPSEVCASIAASPEAHRVRQESVAGVVSLCRELGLVDPRLRTVWSRVTDAGRDAFEL